MKKYIFIVMYYEINYTMQNPRCNEKFHKVFSIKNKALRYANDRNANKYGEMVIYFVKRIIIE